MLLCELFFLNSANLICRDTDISKYFRESLGIRDNENHCISLFVRMPFSAVISFHCNRVLEDLCSVLVAFPGYTYTVDSHYLDLAYLE